MHIIDNKLQKKKVTALLPTDILAHLTCFFFFTSYSRFYAAHHCVCGIFIACFLASSEETFEAVKGVNQMSGICSASEDSAEWIIKIWRHILN